MGLMSLLYSIWLLPQAAQEQALQAVIDSLADQHGTVRFQSHLTVCGSLRNIAALDAASAYVKQSGLLPLTAIIEWVGIPGATGIEARAWTNEFPGVISLILRGRPARESVTTSGLPV